MQKPYESRGLPRRVASATHVFVGVLAATIGLIFFVACSKVPPLPALEAPDGRFFPALASAHYTQLASLGPRTPASEAESLARTYLARALRKTGAEIENLAGEGGLRHVIATLPGRSPDRLLVVAPWPVTGGRAGLDDAGAAVALELARAASTRPPGIYGLVVAFAEVRAEEAPSVAETASPGDGWTPAEARARVRRAGEDLVQQLVERGSFERIRGALVLEPRADGPTRIARDLRSHPVFRSIFWRVADDLGLASLFPDEATWSSPIGLQGALHTAGFGAVLALVDERASAPAFAAVPARLPAPAGPEVAAEAAPEDWARVGLVADEGLARWMRRLERVDAFAPGVVD